jgi:hypothetical protein
MPSEKIYALVPTRRRDWRYQHGADVGGGLLIFRDSFGVGETETTKGSSESSSPEVGATPRISLSLTRGDDRLRHLTCRSLGHMSDGYICFDEAKKQQLRLFVGREVGSDASSDDADLVVGRVVLDLGSPESGSECNRIKSLACRSLARHDVLRLVRMK